MSELVSRIYKVLNESKRQESEQFGLKWSMLTKEGVLKWWNTNSWEHVVLSSTP